MCSIRVALMAALAIPLATSKVYKRCELARELRDVHEIPSEQLATWVCIIKHESNFNTSALNPGSGDHGLFQISHMYWCAPVGHACGVDCSALEDDDIEDDVVCARRIFRQHQRISGDGFNAWAVYPYYCKGDVSRYIKDCFQEKDSGVVATTPTVASPQTRLGASVGSKPPFKLSTTAPVLPEIVKEDNRSRKPYYDKSEKIIVYKSGKSNYAFNWKANGFRLIKTDAV